VIGTDAGVLEVLEPEGLPTAPPVVTMWCMPETAIPGSGVARAAPS